MRRQGLLFGSVLLTVGLFLSACGGEGGPLVHRLEIVIGANVPTIAEGELEATLYAFDPTVADLATETLDRQRIPFRHTQGAATRTTVTLTGQVPRGLRTSVGVTGYERRGDTLEQVLWEDQESTDGPMPTRVELHPSPNTPPPEAEQLAESLLDWQVLKETHGGDYEYDVVFTSWVGFRSTTTLEVRDDEVVGRSYEAYDAEGELTESWTEAGGALGSHESGAPLRTVEALYAVCRDEVLTQNRSENDIFLEFHDDGVLKQCEYFPKNCADDCFVGVSIDDLRFLDQGVAEAFAITTDSRAYVATCTEGDFAECTFSIEATYQNRTDRPVYLQRCYPDSAYPIYGVPTLIRGRESAYSPVYGCVGHDQHLEVLPGEVSTDVLAIRGPWSRDGVTGEPFGVFEGAFQLRYDVRACAGETECDEDPLLETQRLSAPFKVTLEGQAPTVREQEAPQLTTTVMVRLERLRPRYCRFDLRKVRRL